MSTQNRLGTDRSGMLLDDANSVAHNLPEALDLPRSRDRISLLNMRRVSCQTEPEFGGRRIGSTAENVGAVRAKAVVAMNYLRSSMRHTTWILIILTATSMAFTAH